MKKIFFGSNRCNDSCGNTIDSNRRKSKRSNNIFAVLLGKKVLWTLLVTIFVLCCVVGLIVLQGCSVSKYKLVMRQVSEYRKSIFVGEADNFSATFTTGKREDPYVYDGSKASMVEFGVLSVKFGSDIADNPEYILFIDTLQYSGKLERNPYDNTYVADIEHEISSNADIYLKIYAEGINEHITMVSKSKDWKIGYKQAIRLAVDEWDSIVYSYIDGKQLSAEVFVKIVADGEQKYWYVSMLCPNGDNYTCLIDVNSGEILARKDNLIA